MPWALVRTVSDLPLTVAVDVLMRLLELLAVGVALPLPYLPYPVLVGVVFWALVAVGVVPAVPEPELLPQAAKSRTSAPNISKENQKCAACFATYTSLCIVFSFPGFLLDPAERT